MMNRPVGSSRSDSDRLKVLPKSHLDLLPDVQSEWRAGPRTPLWDALWRRILRDMQLRGETSEKRRTG
jgi:hypothetical protein